MEGTPGSKAQQIEELKYVLKHLSKKIENEEYKLIKHSFEIDTPVKQTFKDGKFNLEHTNVNIYKLEILIKDDDIYVKNKG